MTDLLPCPFCGSDPMPDYCSSTDGPAYSFHCHAKDCPAWPNAQGETEAEAVAAWNTRSHPSPSTQDLVEQALAKWRELPDEERNGERPYIMGFNAGWDEALAHQHERRLAYSSPDVVPNGLVPVAFKYDSLNEQGSFVQPNRAHMNLRYWTETPLYPSSAIEAAQMAARKEALESEKPCKNCGFLPEKTGQGGVGSTDLDPNQTACDGGKIG